MCNKFIIFFLQGSPRWIIRLHQLLFSSTVTSTISIFSSTISMYLLATLTHFFVPRTGRMVPCQWPLLYSTSHMVAPSLTSPQHKSKPSTQSYVHSQSILITANLRLTTFSWPITLNLVLHLKWHFSRCQGGNRHGLSEYSKVYNYKSKYILSVGSGTKYLPFITISVKLLYF